MSGAGFGLLLILGVFAADLKPSEVLDLSRWTLTLPLDADGNERADEVSSETLLGGFQDRVQFLCRSDQREPSPSAPDAMGRRRKGQAIRGASCGN